MKKKSVLIWVLSALFVALFSIGPYIVYSSFSLDNTAWASFGTYLSGVSGFFNVIVFIGITFIISRYDGKRKKYELNFMHRKEVFNRYLSSYEKFVSNLYALKTKTARHMATGISKGLLSIDELLELYISMKTLYQYSTTYIIRTMGDTEQNDIPDVINQFLENDLYSIITIIDNDEGDDILHRQILETNKNIDSVIDAIGQTTKKYIGGAQVE